MKKILFSLLAVLGIVVAFAFDGGEAVAMATLAAPVIIKGVEVKDFASYLTAKGVKDISDDLQGATTDELHSYYTTKLEFELLELKERLKTLEGGSETEVKAAKAEIESLKQAVKDQGITVKAIQTGALTGRSVNEVENSISKALSENLENFKKAKEGKHEFKFNISTKAAGTMSIAGNVSGGNMPQAERLPGVNDIAERNTVTYNLCSKITTDRNVIEWVYEANQDGTIDGTAEAAVKDNIDNDFVVASVSLKKYPGYFKVSTEMLDDIDFMASWLRNKLLVRLFLAVDNGILNHDGTSNRVDGILNNATTWAAGTFANTVDNANDVDTLVVGKTQIETANHNVGALTIMMHPNDIAGLMLTKLSATDKRYVDRLIMVGSTLTLDGTPIVKNNNIAEGDFLIGDFSKAVIVERSSVSVEVGLSGDDFINNVRTMLAEWRGALFIENNDRTSFVTGTFATTNAALETP